MVTIRHWYGEMSFGLIAHCTIGDVMKGLDSQIGVPPETVASVNGEVVGGEYVLRDGDAVALIRPGGRKGIGKTWTIEGFAAKLAVPVREVERWIAMGMCVLRTSTGDVRITETSADLFVERGMKPPGDGQGAPPAPFGGATTPSAPTPLMKPGAAPARPKPEWHPATGELCWNGEVIRQYRRQPAEMQIAILTAFQGVGWETSIPNPFESGRPTDRPVKKSARAAVQKSLSSRVEALNKKLKKGTIVFRLVRGGWIAWEPIDATADTKVV